MANVSRIRLAVEDFWRRNSIGDTPADAFPAWWISTKFELSPQDAVRRCASGPGDFGVDGFCLERHGERGWVLNIVQAKFSDSKSYVKKGIGGLEQALPELRASIDRTESAAAPPHAIFGKLRAELERNGVAAPDLRLHFHVIHLCDDAEENVLFGTIAARDRFRDAARAVLPDLFHELFIVGPDQMPAGNGEAPPEAWSIRFDGVQLCNLQSARYYTGLTYLSDLVQLYEQYDDQLFSKNVRYYLFKEQGNSPAKHMRDTLRKICTGPKESAEPPDHFAMFHNGVTMCVQSLELNEGKISIRQPTVLNGCQTIRNASRFAGQVKDIDAERWAQVPVPVRILVATDEELIRQVTVSNNRQIPVRPSAFYANDRLQLELTRRFAARGIFYERQQSAFQNIRTKRPLVLEEQYQNSVAAPVTMEELAQAIAVAGDKPALTVAARVASLFEESPYGQIFSEKHLQHIELLVFLRNLFKTVKLVLKDIKDRSSKLDGLPLERFRYPAARILARYVVRFHPEDVAEFGTEVFGHLGPTHPFRVTLVKYTHQRHSGLQQLIPDVWDDGEVWAKADDSERVRKALKRLRLEDFDVFERYAGAEVL